MFGKHAEATNQESFSFDHKDAVKPPGITQAPERALYMIGGGLLAAVSVIAALKAAYETFGPGNLGTAEGLSHLAVLAIVYAAGVYAAAYGYASGDHKRALKITGTVLLITAAVIAVITLAGGFSWGSDDGDSDSGDSGDRGGSSDNGSRWSPHFDNSSWGWGRSSTQSKSRGSQPAASVCLSCGKRMAGPGGICTACTIGW